MTKKKTVFPNPIRWQGERYVDTREYKTYEDKLKHPMWQRRRLEILNRDDWQCTLCGDFNSPLHVHHRYYEGDNPWDVPDDALVTVCEKCHDKEHKNLPKAVEHLSAGLKKHGCLYPTISSIGELLLSLPLDTDIPSMFYYMIWHPKVYAFVKENMIAERDKKETNE